MALGVRVTAAAHHHANVHLKRAFACLFLEAFHGFLLERCQRLHLLHITVMWRELIPIFLGAQKFRKYAVRSVKKEIGDLLARRRNRLKRFALLNLAGAAHHARPPAVSGQDRNNLNNTSLIGLQFRETVGQRIQRIALHKLVSLDRKKIRLLKSEFDCGNEARVAHNFRRRHFVNLRGGILRVKLFLDQVAPAPGAVDEKRDFLINADYLKTDGGNTRKKTEQTPRLAVRERRKKLFRYSDNVLFLTGRLLLAISGRGVLGYQNFQKHRVEDARPQQAHANQPPVDERKNASGNHRHDADDKPIR